MRLWVDDVREPPDQGGNVSEPDDIREAAYRSTLRSLRDRVEELERLNAEPDPVLLTRIEELLHERDDLRAALAVPQANTAFDLLIMVREFDNAMEVGRAVGPLPNSLRRDIDEWLASTVTPEDQA